MSQRTMLIVAFALVGVLAALGLAALGGAGNASATLSPGPSATQVAVASGPLAPSPSAFDTAAPTVAPPTAAPTSAPTPPPTSAPTPSAKPSPTPNISPRIVTWDVPKYEDCTNDTAGSITVSWEIRRASGVTISIDGPGIYDTYNETKFTTTLPFGCDQTDLSDTYTLKTVGGTGPAATLTRTVTARPASITSFAMGPGGVAHCPTDSGIVGIDLDFEIRAATGAELLRDGALYSTYSSKVVHTSGIMFECEKEFTTFRLTTTGGYGGNATKQITVDRQIP